MFFLVFSCQQILNFIFPLFLVSFFCIGWTDTFAKAPTDAGKRRLIHTYGAGRRATPEQIRRAHATPHYRSIMILEITSGAFFQRNSQRTYGACRHCWPSFSIDDGGGGKLLLIQVSVSIPTRTAPSHRGIHRFVAVPFPA